MENPKVGLNHIRIDGKEDYWKITESRIIKGKEFFLAQTETEEIVPNCIIDENGKLIKEVWQGFEEFIMQSMSIELKEIKKVEEKYAAIQSQQIKMQTGFIGYLEAEVNDNGMSVPSWNTFRATLDVEEFRTELDEIINVLRDGGLKDKQEMKKFLGEYPLSEYTDKNSAKLYGFRIDTETYTYLLKINPTQDKNVTCYCYTKKWLDTHIMYADKGVRFINPHYKLLFRVADGEQIKITDKRTGVTEIRTARYIDDYHVEIASERNNNLFHICEFAERMENNYEVAPLNEEAKTEAIKADEAEVR